MQTLAVNDGPPVMNLIPATYEQAPLAQVQTDEAAQVLGLMRHAIDKGMSPDTMERYEAMYDRAVKRKAEAAFNAAFAAFKRECPPIERKTEDEYITVTRDGVRCKRKYASLDDISMTVDAPLHRNGLTYDWTDAEITPDGVVRRFVLRHVDGHSRAVASPPIPIEGSEAYKKLSAGRKESSASPQQRMGVADTYAKRYSMTSGLGIPTCDEDSDGHADATLSPETISEDQQNTLNDLIIDVGADRAKFLAYFKVGKLAELSVDCFDRAVADLEAFRAKRAKK